MMISYPELDLRQRLDLVRSSETFRLVSKRQLEQDAETISFQYLPNDLG